METRPLGDTGLTVSALGFGAGGIGGEDLTDREVMTLLHRVVDAGLTLIDTARSYGRSEERIGRLLADRRDELVLSTKVGYLVEGHEDWTGPCVAAGIDRALTMLGTDRIDIVHLHSCDAETLQRDDILTALDDARAAGKIRARAYSGENDALAAAIATGAFESLQCSLSVCDPANIRGPDGGAIGRGAELGLGVIVKRSLGNAVWRFHDCPVGRDEELYWRRREALELAAIEQESGLAPGELALRFAAFEPGVSSALVATRSPAHLAENLAALARGPLPAGVRAAVACRHAEHAVDWPGHI